MAIGCRKWWTHVATSVKNGQKMPFLAGLGVNKCVGQSTLQKFFLLPSPQSVVVCF